jgi:hypothetical protein
MMIFFYVYLFPILDFGFPLLVLNGVFPLKYFEPVFQSKNGHTLKKKKHNYRLTLNMERIVMETKRPSSYTEFKIAHFNFEHQNLKICLRSYNNTHFPMYR